MFALYIPFVGPCFHARGCAPAMDHPCGGMSGDGGGSEKSRTWLRERLLVGSFWNPVVGCVSGAQLAWFAHLQIELALVAPMSSRIKPGARIEIECLQSAAVVPARARLALPRLVGRFRQSL